MVAVPLLGLVLSAGVRGVSIDALHATVLAASGMSSLAALAGWFSVPRKGL
jgi:hypothetical protein